MKKLSLLNFRLLMVWTIIVSAILGLIGKIFLLQFVKVTEFRRKADSQQNEEIRIDNPRRPIIDSEGNILAMDIEKFDLFIYRDRLPKDEDKEKIAKQLSQILNKNYYDLTKLLLDKRNVNRVGLDKITTHEYQRILNKTTKKYRQAFEFIKNFDRSYPQKELMSDVVGFVNDNQQGKAGIEMSQNNLLHRQTKYVTVRKTGSGGIIPTSLPRNFFRSNDWKLQLTVNIRLQRAARFALKEKLNTFQAKRGAIIIMNVIDGSILALVCEPTFDPNVFYNVKGELLKNWTVTDLYEPGSTFKPINIALALEAGVIKLDTVIQDIGFIKVDNWNIYNASLSGNGLINIAEVLQTSSNVAMVQIMQRLKKEDYYNRLLQLDITQKTNIDLPGEVKGRLKSKEVFTTSSIEAAATSFGQGFSLTPIKLAQLHGALANGGKLVTPHLTKGLVNPEGSLAWIPEYKSKQIFSPSVSTKVIGLMETVVNKGSGKASKIQGYRIGGKTGTAQKAGKGGYLPNSKITSFVSILPITSPKYLVLVVLDEPKGNNTSGSTVAAPAAKIVTDALIYIEGMPPTN
ncbi:peptidoglycan D,D-transpeptidase FtsI family protein [Candidatus Atelocyanobacterium thalassae]|uniref:Stage V sporulation protein D n=1 Tax=cyanobacterium endosymbiont of Braarudosphaera bigelowii TaxID=1285375 RepID=A0ABM7U5F8_9CHRO|nr:penicillin-binding protein 2 [Candidatus Atelocyanobacterium thalassa]BDA39929.1 stage V sporulation protein D [cyanobacterium endosymbiont of Braarudosphaera bigelowii]